MPSEIVHRAAPCRNVPVTFTLDRMSVALLKITMTTSVAAVFTGCAALGDPAERLVLQYQEFLLSDGSDFDTRVERYLGLKPEDDIREKRVGFFSRLGPRRGAAIWSGVVSSRTTQGNELDARVSVYFDPKVICVTPKHLSVLGKIENRYTPPPSPHRPEPYTPPRVIGQTVDFASPTGIVRLDLQFWAGCLEQVEHSVRIPLK